MQRMATILLGCTALGGCFFTTTQDDTVPFDPGPTCDETFELTAGELGVLAFSYDYGAFICAFGCSASKPIAERAQVEVTVYAEGDLPPVTVASDAPDVAEFEVGDDGDIIVKTHAPGTARLEIRDGASGDLVDALPLLVKPVASIADAEEEPGAIVVMNGGTTSVALELLDERGCPLVGIGGVDYSLEGGISEAEVTLIDALAAWLFESIFGSAVEEAFSLEALALGSGTVAVRAPSGASLDVDVSVVDETAVASLTLSKQSEPMMVDQSYAVDAHARTADGVVVRSPSCAWDLSPASGPLELSSVGRDSAYVTASSPGSATVGCTVGSASAAIDVTFQ
jgi:hypothetical protein